MATAVKPSHKGKFKAKAAAAGMSTAAYARKKAGATGTIGKEARLAKTFEKFRPKKSGVADRLTAMRQAGAFGKKKKQAA